MDSKDYIHINTEVTTKDKENAYRIMKCIVDLSDPPMQEGQLNIFDNELLNYFIENFVVLLNIIDDEGSIVNYVDNDGKLVLRVGIVNSEPILN